MDDTDHGSGKNAEPIGKFWVTAVLINFVVAFLRDLWASNSIVIDQRTSQLKSDSKQIRDTFIPAKRDR